MTPLRRLRACVETWPGAETGKYDPRCCRFPKSCSADVYDPERVSDHELEASPEASRPAASGVAEFRLKEFTAGPSHGTDRTAGWLALADEQGVELWSAWISPIPNEVWAEIGLAAARTQQDPNRAVHMTSVCDLTGLLPARVCHCTGRAGCPNVDPAESNTGSRPSAGAA